MKKIIGILSILIIAGILLWIFKENSTVFNHKEKNIGEESQIANPASVFCEQNQGKIEIVQSKDNGQEGICHFADGRICEERAYYKGECEKHPVCLFNPGTICLWEKDQKPVKEITFSTRTNNCDVITRGETRYGWYEGSCKKQIKYSYFKDETKVYFYDGEIGGFLREIVGADPQTFKEIQSLSEFAGTKAIGKDKNHTYLNDQIFTGDINEYLQSNGVSEY